MSLSGSLLIKPFDPLLHDIELRFAVEHYPAGFRLNLVTNSQDILEAAAESWGMYRAPEFETPPLSLRVVVQPEGGVAPPPVFRSQGRLFSIVSDRDSFAALDSASLSGFCFLSAAIAADHAALRFYFLESSVYVLLSQRYIVPLHAACVARNGSGVLLCGPSGAGKSSLAFACARAGWTYISDDATWLLPDTRDRMAIGKSHVARFRHDAPSLFPELEGYAARARNGKLTLEVPTADFPQLCTSRRAPIGCLVLLDRRAGSAARARQISSSEVVESLLNDMPVYEREVNSMYARTVRKLAAVPAYTLSYESLDDAIRLLSELV